MPAFVRTVLLLTAGGVLYAAAQPPYDWTLAGWVTLIPLLVVSSCTTASGAYCAGFTYGAVLFSATVPWVFEAVRAYFGTSAFGAIATSAAIGVLFVAGYLGVFAVAARRLLRAGRWRALIALPALWTAYELARSTAFTGMPWALLGHSQWRHPTLVQIADLGGAYAVSYLVALGNVGLYLACRREARSGWRFRLAPLGITLAAVMAVHLYGRERLEEEMGHDMGRAIDVLVVQEGADARRVERGSGEAGLVRYLDLSRRGLRSRALDLIVWPEYALAAYPERDAFVMPALRQLAHETSAGLVFGAPRTVGDAAARRFFNSAYYVGSSGGVATYDKRHLVPFAEYRPAGFGEAFAAVSDETFSAGDVPGLFTGPAGTIGALICYEVTFPNLSRALAQGGAEVLVNLSNDGWLDRAGLGAGAQHLAAAVFRAVETRRPLVRAARSGVSGFIDATGRPHDLLAENIAGATTARVVPRRDRTPYVRYGDLFALGCVAVGCAAAIGARET